MAKKFNLKELIDTIDWVTITGSTRGSSRLPDDAVSIGFYKSKKDSHDVDEVRVRFGKDVLDAIHWKPGDKIVAMHAPDDIMSFLLVKCETGAGRTLSQESGSPHSRLHFKWNRPIPLKLMPPKLVEYKTYKNYIYFRIGDSNAVGE